jgi:hypothetical protein
MIYTYLNTNIKYMYINSIYYLLYYTYFKDIYIYYFLLINK